MMPDHRLLILANCFSIIAVLPAVSGQAVDAKTASVGGAPKECGGYAVAVAPGNPQTGGGRVDLSKAGRVVYSVNQFPEIFDVECTVLAQDRGPELIVWKWTGGVSCCQYVEIVLLRGTPRRVLEFWGTIRDIRDFASTGSKQIFALLNNLRYFDDLCGACSPVWPVVYAYERGHYVERSARFPAPVLAYTKEFEHNLAGFAKIGNVEDEKGDALGLLAAYLVIGRERDGWTALSRLAAPEVIAWLKAREDELRKKLREVQSQ